MTDEANADCPTCGPTALVQHPRRADVLRCRNCAEWLHVIPTEEPPRWHPCDDTSEHGRHEWYREFLRADCPGFPPGRESNQ